LPLSRPAYDAYADCLLQYILRKAFDVAPKGGKVCIARQPVAAPLAKPLFQPYLPESILWRQKEQFSDGVGYSWIDG